MKYITVLDYEMGRVFQYEFLKYWEEDEDSENIEWFLVDIKGHRLSSIEWMTHKNPQVIAN